MKHPKLVKLIASTLMGLMLCSCGGEVSDIKVVSFDANTTYKTNNVLPQSVKVGGKVKKPSVTITEDNPDNYKVYAWYKEKSLTNQWNFKKDTVENNMTLYAEWKKTFTVNYFVGNETIPANTVTVFDGDLVKEHPDYCTGFKYIGSFTDKDYNNPFDYSTPITQDLNIYMKKSDGIDLYEGNPAGGLYDNLEIFQSTDQPSTPETPVIGTISRTQSKDAVFIDFGYAPDIGDPYAELALNIDISHSQVIHLVMKHYGYGTSMSFYFTTLLNVDTFDYSATGPNYNANFYAVYNFKDNEIGMTEEDDFIDISIDLAANSFYNGYSVWGTSPYLGKLRIQPTYKSTGPDDHSNTMLLKRIYGSDEGYSEGVKVEDSDKVKAMLYNEESTEGEDISTGFSFPRDAQYIKNDDLARTYLHKEGLLMHFKNEIYMRDVADPIQKVSFVLPTNENGDVIGDKIVDLENNKTLYITLQNFGYANNLRIIIENDYSGKTYTNLKIDQRMPSSKTYSINLSKESLMIHTLLSISIEYEALGVDNAILLSSIYLGETLPYDIPGISFDDKNCFGLTATGDASITYSPSYSSVEIDAKDENAYITSSKEDIKLISMGYYGLSITYSKPKSSLIEGVYISLFTDGEYKSEYYFETPSITNAQSSVDFNPREGGKITNIKIRFKGTGIIRLSSLNFVASDAYSLNFSNDMSDGIYFDWIRGWQYSYDEINRSSGLVADPSASNFSCGFYLAIGNAWYGHNIYNCQNLYLEGKTKFILIYRNVKDDANLNITLGFCPTIDGNPDGAGLEVLSKVVTLRGHMVSYEWDYVSIDIPDKFTPYYLGKITFGGYATDFNFRLASVI